jgi:hypothetical protein
MMDPIRNEGFWRRAEGKDHSLAAPSHRNPDPRLELTDSIFERLFRLMACWGLSPEDVSLRALAAASRVESIDSKARNQPIARTYQEVHAVAEILRLWFQDADFVDAIGEPRRLLVGGPHPNFTDLVDRTTRGIEVQAVLEELLATGAVTQESSGEIAIASRLVACDGAWRRAEVGLYAAENLLASVERNVEEPTSKDALQCETVSLTFDRRQLPRIARHLRQQSIGFLEQADDWLHQHSVKGPSREGDAATVAVGLYITVRDEPEP